MSDSKKRRARHDDALLASLENQARDQWETAAAEGRLDAHREQLRQEILAALEERGLEPEDARRKLLGYLNSAAGADDTLVALVCLQRFASLGAESPR